MNSALYRTAIVVSVLAPAAMLLIKFYIVQCYSLTINLTLFLLNKLHAYLSSVG